MIPIVSEGSTDKLVLIGKMMTWGYMLIESPHRKFILCTCRVLVRK